MKKLFLSACLTLTASLVAPNLSLAQNLPVAVATDTPRSAAFNGSNAISLPAHDSLNLTDVSTIEFWVQPNWTRLAYPPVIVSGFSDEAVRYAIVMAANKKAIGLYSGGDWDYVEFDFDDGRPHHVAFVNMGELTDVYVDGVMIDSISQPIEDIPVRTFHIGTIDGFDNQFVGTIGEVRLWDTALDGEDIAAFRNTHIFSAEGLAHPDLISLVGVSDFANRRRNFTLVNNQSSMTELFTDLAMARGDLPPEADTNQPRRLPDGTTIPPFTAEELAILADLDNPVALPAATSSTAQPAAATVPGSAPASPPASTPVATPVASKEGN